MRICLRSISAPFPFAVAHSYSQFLNISFSLSHSLNLSASQVMTTIDIVNVCLLLDFAFARIHLLYVAIATVCIEFHPARQNQIKLTRIHVCIHNQSHFNCHSCLLFFYFFFCCYCYCCCFCSQQSCLMRDLFNAIDSLKFCWFKLKQADCFRLVVSLCSEWVSLCYS